MSRNMKISIVAKAAKGPGGRNPSRLVGNFLEAEELEIKTSAVEGDPAEDGERDADDGGAPTLRRPTVHPDRRGGSRLRGRAQ